MQSDESMRADTVCHFFMSVLVKFQSARNSCGRPSRPTDNFEIHDERCMVKHLHFLASLAMFVTAIKW